jgi:H2-forming N5,N10-methylenetetrahydromethanopterin dehydrogenase-like enzyme
MEEKGIEKVTCDCGSVVLKKNMSSHVKTKKHQACVGGPSLHRSGVSFADAQHTDRADVSDDEEDDDMDDGEDLDELMDMVEELGKAHLVLDQKLDNIMNTLANLLNVIQQQKQ